MGRKEWVRGREELKGKRRSYAKGRKGKEEGCKLKDRKGNDKERGGVQERGEEVGKVTRGLGLKGGVKGGFKNAVMYITTKKKKSVLTFCICTNTEK